jgi:hypothetical protein
MPPATRPSLSRIAHVVRERKAPAPPTHCLLKCALYAVELRRGRDIEPPVVRNHRWLEATVDQEVTSHN